MSAAHPAHTGPRTIHLTPSDSQFHTVVQELVSTFRLQACVPILGAGVSLSPPSGMPLGGTLEAALRFALWASVGAFQRQSPLPQTTIESAKGIIGAARLERMLDVLQRTHGVEPIREFLSVLCGGHWNKNHAALAALAAAGHLPHCVTFNFDLLIEQAVADRRAVAETICPLRDFASFQMPDIQERPCTSIYKPHGSFAPPYYPQGEFDLLAPTLEDLGNRPDPRNQQCFAELLSAGRSALVAGYSDHDWDIFPILQERASHLSHVYWVQYLRPDAILQRAHPTGMPFNRVHAWLGSRGERATLLLGDFSVLLEHVCAALKIKPDEPSKAPSPDRTPPTQQFLAGPDEVFATSVSFTLLLQDRGDFHRQLVQWLLDRPEASRQIGLAALLHRSAAHACHTGRDVRRALQHMSACVRLKARSHAPIPYPSNIADELVWMGYEHLCLIKRPSVRWALVIPAKWHAWRGVRLMNRGLIQSRQLPKAKRRKLRALVRYYRGDLLHSWAGVAFVVGGVFRPVGRFLSRLASEWYARAAKIDPGDMDWEYYWLRRMEARVFAGAPIEDTAEALRKLQDIEWSYGILQNHVQRGNTMAYKALLIGGDPARLPEARELMDQAEQIWLADDGFVPSGLMRLILFRRVLGIQSWMGTCRDILRLRRLIRDHQRRT